MESPFHKTKSIIWGNALLHEVSGQHFTYQESRNSEKVDCFLTLILVGVQERKLSFKKIFLLRYKVGSRSPRAHCKCDIAPIT
jgi:hypothetical protein